MLQAPVLLPAAAAVLLHLQQVEAAKEEDEEHVGDDDDGDGRGVVREFAVPVACALREFTTAATRSSTSAPSRSLARSTSGHRSRPLVPSHSRRPTASDTEDGC